MDDAGVLGAVLWPKEEDIRVLADELEMAVAGGVIGVFSCSVSFSLSLSRPKWPERESGLARRPIDFVPPGL